MKLKNKINQENNKKTKKITIKRIKTKLDIKIKWNQMSSNSSQVNLIIYIKKNHDENMKNSLNTGLVIFVFKSY